MLYTAKIKGHYSRALCPAAVHGEELKSSYKGEYYGRLILVSGVGTNFVLGGGGQGSNSTDLYGKMYSSVISTAD